MKKLIIIPILLAFQSCCLLGHDDMVSAAAIRPAVTRLTQRYEAYVIGDGSLEEWERNIALMVSYELKRTMNEAMKPALAFPIPLMPEFEITAPEVVE